MRCRFALLIVCSFLLTASFARASEETSNEVDSLSFCRFGPKLRALSPTVNKPEKDSCTGTVKIQGVIWECGKITGFDDTLAGYLTRLRAEAKDRCAKSCEARGEGCKGNLDTPSHCALQTTSDDAVSTGKEMGCRADCSGPALIYCSLYDTDFRTNAPELLAKQGPNCHCYKK